MSGSLSMDGTDSSMSECDLIKLRVTSGRVCESLTHWPGLGSGTFKSFLKKTIFYKYCVVIIIPITVFNNTTMPPFFT